ncbi:hypothetical protein C8R45DRAFT_1072976 [Mycena sanguinolenta]|nr:hypothetical protein C8R45DRAFT_1072976 [Mycena sanguinolenta]
MFSDVWVKGHTGFLPRQNSVGFGGVIIENEVDLSERPNWDKVVVRFRVAFRLRGGQEYFAASTWRGGDAAMTRRKWWQATSRTNDTLYFFLLRVPADAWRFLYSDTELAADAVRARWRFVIAATIHEVGRRSFSRSYVRNRLQEAKRWMELVKKARMFNRNLTPASPLTREESEELQRFNAVFYSSVVDHDLQQLVRHCFCDGCGRDIHDARQFCVQCMDATFSDWLDMYSSCIEQEVVPQREGFTHVQSHLQIKVYRYLHDGDMAWTIPEAKVVAGRAKTKLKLAASADASTDTAAVKTKTMLTSSQDDETTTAFQRPRCASCREAISPPCFVCIFCVKDVYTCMKCEGRRLNLSPDPFAATDHKLFRPLVYIFNTDPIPEIVATDAKLNSMGKNITNLDTRMTGLESKMTSLDSQMSSVHQRLEALEQRLENRLQALESILHAVGEKLLYREISEKSRSVKHNFFWVSCKMRIFGERSENWQTSDSVSSSGTSAPGEAQRDLFESIGRVHVQLRQRCEKTGDKSRSESLQGLAGVMKCEAPRSTRASKQEDALDMSQPLDREDVLEPSKPFNGT